MKKMNLHDIKSYYGDKNSEFCFETGKYFIVRRYDKYDPDLTFAIPKVWQTEYEKWRSGSMEGKPADPMKYETIKELTDAILPDFKGNNEEVLFGKFLKTKDDDFFVIKHPSDAEHILIRINWGGCFSRKYGLSKKEAESLESLFYCNASSNGGGSGYKYIVVPMREDLRKIACEYYKKLETERVEMNMFLQESENRLSESKIKRKKYISRIEKVKNDLCPLREKIYGYDNYNVFIDDGVFRLTQMNFPECVNDINGNPIDKKYGLLNENRFDWRYVDSKGNFWMFYTEATVKAAEDFAEAKLKEYSGLVKLSSLKEGASDAR